MVVILFITHLGFYNFISLDLSAMLYYLMYYGVESIAFTHKDLNQLLKQAAEKNELLNITGKLVYCEGAFLQLLEGPEYAVKSIYQSILKDKRLITIKLITVGYTQNRHFPDWSMGFGQVSIAEINKFEDCNYPNVSDYLKTAPTFNLLKLLALKNQVA